MKHIVWGLAGLVMLAACAQGGWTERERAIIGESGTLLNVYTFPQDSVVLRAKSVDLTDKELKSAQLQTLLARMLKTVTDPSQDGVGIAAPQVGINRRIVLVQRLDKAGEPFEAYVNIRIDSLYGETTHGPEGCLSVPGYRGLVPRKTDVEISYVNPQSGEVKKEHIQGYTAIIFQHECDHLDGILYIDKADSVYLAPGR